MEREEKKAEKEVRMEHGEDVRSDTGEDEGG